MLYYFGYYVFFIFVHLAFQLKVFGLKNIPGRKPFIMCSNHMKWIDPVILGIILPVRYKVNFMAKKELFSNPVIGYLMRKVHAFPVNRNEADVTAIRKAYQVLREGNILGMFPEGSRSMDGELQKAYNGAALIAVRSGVPILPVAISGPYRLFRPLRVYIGEPFVLPPLVFNKRDEKKEVLDRMSREIMNRISQLQN